MNGIAKDAVPYLVQVLKGVHTLMQVGSVSYERQPIADHAINLASTIQLNLKRSLEALGVVSGLSAVQCVEPWQAPTSLQVHWGDIDDAPACVQILWYQ